MLKLKNNEISKILSIPEMAINTNKILLQMQIFSLLQILLKVLVKIQKLKNKKKQKIIKKKKKVQKQKRK